MDRTYIIDKTNRRSFYLWELLKTRGEKVAEYNEKETYGTKDAVFVLSPSRTVVGSMLEKMPHGSIVFCNHIDVDTEAYPHIKIINLLQHPKYRLVNSRLTAEGALSLAITSTDKALIHCNLLVLGYGVLARSIAEVFAPLVASVSIATYDLGEIGAASERYQTYYKREYVTQLDKFDLIINTIPANVLNAEDVTRPRADAVYIELASPPYGFDRQLGANLSCAYALGSALPDKYSPLSAGRILAKCIDEVCDKTDEEA